MLAQLPTTSFNGGQGGRGVPPDLPQLFPSCHGARQGRGASLGGALAFETDKGH